ncbi:MAG: hypothetical protein GX264_07615 [Clostridiales bacterium]|jgi:hypothetical protein|nr:hypothetical protein [Clostridiales bacterium]
MKSLRITAVIIVLSLLFSFASCKRGGAAPDETSAAESTVTENTTAAQEEQKINIEDYITEIEVPYHTVTNPCLYGDKLFFTSTTYQYHPDIVPPNNLLLMYDIKTNKTEVITKVPDKHLILFVSANDRWLVWTVSTPNSTDKLYLMDLVNGGTKEILPDEAEFFYWLRPYLVGDSIYWLEAEHGTEAPNIRKVIKYDCKTGARVELQSLYDGVSSLYAISLNDGHLLWQSLFNDKQYYFLYDTETNKITAIEPRGARIDNAVYAGGLIYSTEAFKENYQTNELIYCVIDPETKEYLVWNEEYDPEIDLFPEEVCGSYVYIVTRLTQSINKLEGEKLKSVVRLPEKLKGWAVPAEGNRFVIVQDSSIAIKENNGLHPDTHKLFIADLSELD